MPSVEAIATDVRIAPEESARAGFHALLARLFVTPPVTELLCQIAARGPIGSAGGAGDLPAAWDPLRLAAAACSPEGVHQEFDDLFVAVGEPRVALDGSYYLTGRLMETPLAVLRDDLAGLGLARLRGVLETEVHVAAPAEVMRLLILDTRRP